MLLFGLYITRKVTFMMWLLLLATLLQILLILERLLFRVLILFTDSGRTDSKKLADNSVLGSCSSSFWIWVTSPGQMIVGAMNVIIRNLIMYTAIVFFCSFLYVLNTNTSEFLAGYAKTYNSGLGQVIDAYLQVLNLPSVVFRGVVPIWNLAVQMTLQLLYYVAVPFTRVHPDVFPQFIENLMNAMMALVISTQTFVAHVYTCVVPNTEIQGSGVVFLPQETQCFANVNYYEMDMMTPGIYTRKTSLNLQDMLITSCGPMGVIIELVMFPLLDFNFYKAINGVVNIVLHVAIALPVMTINRCEYGRTQPDLTGLEKTIMCIPDFSGLYAGLSVTMRAVGVMIDNWLNVAVILIERAMTGSVSVSCDSAYEQRFNMTRAGELFGVSPKSLKIVSMTDRLFAVTDGVSTEYHTTTITDHTEMAIGNWPFQINVGYGVAAVQHGETADMDEGGDFRTGLLGCQCLDAINADGVPNIEVVCASVPYTVHHDNETEYNISTIHRLNFDAAITGTYLTCATAKIKVSTLRFSQKRFSSELDGSIDVDYLSKFNTFGMAGMQQPRTFTADAVIYVQPLCYDGTSQRCQKDSHNCFPWCMGLHVAGQTGQNITMYNARHWDENVDMKQVDCAVTAASDVCDSGTSQGLVANEAFNVHNAEVCQQGCTFDYHSETFMKLDAVSESEKSQSFLKQKDLRPTIRIGEQPLVAAGDIMLVRDEETNELVMNRLFDVSRGLFTMRTQHLALVSNQETVNMTQCETQDEDECFSDAANMNRIIDPPGYRLESYTETPTTVSEFGVHWAVNPASSALKNKYEDCASPAPTGGVDFESSYGKARVWTLRPVRESSATSDGNGGLVSYMVIPNFMTMVTRCNEIVNQRVVDLEYINSENILVTVYRAAPKDYDWRTGDVYEGRFFEYSMYYLHPNRKDCTEGQESGNHFSCWKSINLGMFSSPEFVDDKIGTLCPSMRRMPEWGTMVTEMSVAAFGFMKIFLDVVTILPTAWSDISSIFEQPRKRFTFHTTLDTAGETFFDVETIITSIDRSTMIGAHAVAKLFTMLEGRDGYNELQPRLIGSAKVNQYRFNRMSRAVLSGTQTVYDQASKISEPISKFSGQLYDKIPFKKEIGEFGSNALKFLDQKLAQPLFNVFKKAADKMPTKRVMAFGSAAMGRYISVGGLMPPSPPSIQMVMMMRRFMNMATSQFNMNVRLFRLFFMRILVGGQTQSEGISNLVSSVFYELEYDIDRSYFESMRIQCDGLGQIFGRNVLGGTIKQTCLVIPSSMRSTLRAAMVFLVEYRTMDCICRLSSEIDSVAFVRSECLPQSKPFHAKSFTLDFLQAGVNTQRDMCFAYMDAANQELLTAFDPVFNHMYRATANLDSVLDMFLSLFMLKTSNCADFHSSPYVLTLLPEPTDYFMGCMNTFDCRARCLDTYEAFEQALSVVPVTPTYEITHTSTVQSRFFSIEDTENGLDLPPFAIFGMTELSDEACALVCSESNVDNRCIAVAGISDERRIGLGYYCMPHNFMDSVYEYRGPNTEFSSQSTYYKDEWDLTDVVSNIYLLTVDSILEGRPEMLLVSTQKRSNPDLQSLWIFTSDGDRFLLVETETFNPDVKNDYSLNTIDSVRVRPGKRSMTMDRAEILVEGTRFESSGSDYDDIKLVHVCTTYDISITNFLGNLDIDDIDKQTAFNARISRDSKKCLEDVDYEKRFDDKRKIVCLDVDCQDQLRIPLANFRTTNMVRYRVNEDTPSTEYTSSNPQSNLAKILALDPSYALILTSDGSYELNRKLISDLSPRSIQSCADGNGDCINLIVVGRLSVAQTWIHNIYLTIKPDRTFSSQMLGGVNVQQKLTRTLTCSIDNCAACVNSESSFLDIDLQNKCYAASQCGVRRCVGTIINMKRPLCNLGARMAHRMDVLRIGTHGAWNAVASMIIVSVELTNARRETYRISWPQEIFMASVCNTKDFIVETVSTLTAVSGAVLASAHEERVPGASYDANEAAIDVRVHGKEIMFITALTNLLSNIAMAPLYFSIALQKIIDCRVDGFLVIINRITGTSGSDVKILSGTAAQTELSDDLVGICVSKYGDIAATDTDNGSDKVAGLVGQILSDIRSLKISYYFEPYVHMADAAIAWMIGVTTGIMDIAQVVDWAHCKLPVTSMTMRGNCVCSDASMVIPEVQRTARISSATHSLWCSGPMLLSNVDGSDLLIWNPYSLEELLHPDDHGGSGNYDAFLQCLSTSTADCEKHKPVMPKISAQGAEVMQVVTRCRANYQQSTWDDGAIFLGMWDYKFWQESPASFENRERPRVFDPPMVRRLIQISENISPLGGEIADESTITCLGDALEQNVGIDGCMREYFLYSDQARELNVQGTDAYFLYQPNNGPSSFVFTDSCQSFSGDMGSTNLQSGLSYPVTMWSSSSRNRLDVATFHEKTLGSEAQRFETAMSRLDTLLVTKIEPVLDKAETTISDNLKIRSWSFEGDEIHQLIDCVVLGPYASADMQSTFEIPGGRRLPVQQYNRGDPTSRNFHPDPGYMTGGSPARRSIIRSAQEKVQSEYTSGLQEQFNGILSQIKTTYRDINNFLCTCPGGQVSNLTCCKGSYEDITFKAKELFGNIWDFSETMKGQTLDLLTDGDLLEKDLWHNSDFSFTAIEFTDAEKEELHDKYVFDGSKPVREYSRSEVMDQFTQETLWMRCMELLSMSFFTLPVKPGDDNMEVDADMRYDPTANNSAFLHGMEEGIQRILKRAKKDSPVYWTHVHRYMPTDSKWCENLGNTPAPQVSVSEAFYDESQYGTGRFLDTILAHKISETVFIADVPEHCVCGWKKDVDGEEKCEVPSCDGVEVSASLDQTWQDLCTRGHYETRDDLFTFLQVIQETTVYPSWFETCTDVYPSLTWGLLDSKMHKDWFEGTDTEYGVSLQELGSTGPSGLRLGLLGREENSQLNWVRKHKLLQKDPSHLPFNFAKKHTIAQPYCASTPPEWKSDLTEYFRDVFFPMAHTIHTSAVGSYCSTWVVEYALTIALRHIHGDADHPDVIEQDNVQAKWRERCDIQLQQIGICKLRGVYDIIPTDSLEYYNQQKCSFHIGDPHGCTEKFYVTDNCLVMCDDLFYDPCACSNNDDCSTVYFVKSLCTSGLELDPRDFATDPAVKLYSMHWPTSIHQNETKDVAKSILDETLTTIRTELANTTFDETALYNAIKALIIDHDNGKNEGSPPNAFCDDLIDYYDGEAQHPVGYHPTTACLVEDTHMRGFDSWMSTGDGSAWTVDPVRLRNMTLYSSTFGAAHLVCDAAVYGAYGHELNPFYINTRWNENQRVDPAVPITPPSEPIVDMQVRGVPSQSSMDTPIISNDHILQHSVGLIRDWVRWYGADDEMESMQSTLKAEWPQLTDNEYYGLAQDDAVEGCPMPLLRTCETDAECTSSAVSMVCLKPPVNEVNETSPGICAREGTCYQHNHCDESRMCSGEGVCVQPYIIFNNRDDGPVNVQLFSEGNEDCDDTMYGVSEGQGVSSFAHDNGMCSLRNWFMYETVTKDANIQNQLRLVEGNKRFHWPEDIENKSVFERGLLRTTAHACDRSYQHLRSFCGPKNIKSFVVYNNEVTSVEPEKMTGTRTRKKSSNKEYFQFCDMPDSDEITGFLSPYVYGNNSDKIDTLKYVQQTVARCDEFNVCPSLRFEVGGVTIQRKVIQGANFDTNLHRFYWNNDADSCFAAGYRLDTGCSGSTECKCVVDRYTSPLINGLFSNGVSNIPTDTFVRPEDKEWDDIKLNELFQAVLQGCEHAFTNEIEGETNFDLFKKYFEILTREYVSSDRVRVMNYANTLLLSLFGIDSKTGVKRGIDDVDDYVSKTKCVRHLNTLLTRAEDVVKTEELPPYRVESVDVEPIPGKSLYFFHERATIPIPFDWFWKCVVMAVDETEGGVQRNWFELMTAPGASDNLVCTNMNGGNNERMRLREHLRTTDKIYEILSGDGGTDNFIGDIDQVVSVALDELQITMLPNIFCARCDNDKSLNSMDRKKLYHVNTSWIKTGFDLTSTVSEMVITQPESPKEIYSMYRYVYEQLLGSLTPDRRETVSTLRELDRISEVTLDEEVDTDTSFLPVYVFNRLQEYFETHDGIYQDNTYNIKATECADIEAELSGTYLAASSSKCTGKFKELNYYEFEFVDGVTKYFDNVQQTRKYLTLEQAKYEIFKIVQREIFNTDNLRNFVLRDDGLKDLMMPLNPSTLETLNLVLETNSEWNEWMTEKDFTCHDGEEIESSETNMAHKRLRSCVEALTEEIGWKVDERVKLEVGKSLLTGSFFPSFSEPISQTYLDDLSSEAISENAPAKYRMCYKDMRNGDYQIMNPLWAGNFDVTSCPDGVACGCDTMLQYDWSGGNTRVVDTRCGSKLSQCKDQFPRFYQMLYEETPDHCANLGRTLSAVGMRREGSLGDNETPLCRRTVPTTECTGRFGSLHGHQGRTVDDLYSSTDERPVHQEGLFVSTNSIFRRRHTDRFTPSVLPVTMGISKSDIGGHGLEFGIGSDGNMHLDCVHLSNNHTGCGNNENEFLPGTHNWLSEIENLWSWRHSAYKNEWDPDMEKGPSVSWKCPLQWWSAFSNSSKSYAVRTPMVQRNRVRFQHITGTKYNNVHPVVQSLIKLPNLRPARFMSDNTACMDETCTGKLDDVISDMYAMANGTWKHVYLGGMSSDKIIDWPETPYILDDDGETSFGENVDGSVIDRLPSFAMTYEERDSPLLTTPKSASVEPAGVCHMRRLPRFELADESSWTEDCYLQMCTRESGGVRCKYTNGSDVGFVTFNYTLGHVNTRQTPQRHRRCSACEDHTGQFRGRDMKQSTLTTDIMSVGEPISIKTERMVAHYLRSKVCPHAQEDACSELDLIFKSDVWKSGQFLHNLLHADEDSGFYKNWVSVSTDAATSTPTSDEDLWGRNWVFCDHSSPTGCDGSISKSDWLEPNTRTTKCRDAIINSSPRDRPVEFCLLDSNTEQLCTAVAEWNQEILRILCQAAGLASCPDYGFFYTPASYSVENQEFASETVAEFYTSLDPSACPAAPNNDNDELVQMQIESNNNLLHECASVSIQPIREILQSIRGAVSAMFRIHYFATMLMFQVLQIALGSVIGPSGTSLVSAAVDRLVKYVGLLMESISNFFHLILEAVWTMLIEQTGSFGKFLQELISLMCRILNFMRVDILCPMIKDVLVPIINKIGDAVKFFNNGAGKSIKRGAADLIAIADDHLCDYTDCDFQFLSEGEHHNGALPVPTRCWSSYLTYYGDTDSLSCSRADTCRRSLTDNTRIVCAQCPAAMDGYDDYKCEPMTKLCTCNVQRYVRTECSMNDDCNQAGASCNYLLSDLSLSTGVTSCDACQTQRVCYLDVLTDQRFCACGLFPLRFSTCNQGYTGKTMMPGSDKLCLYQPDSKFLSRNTYSAQFSDLLSVPCMEVGDISSVYCTNIIDQGQHMLVAKSVMVTGRRLLGVDEDGDIPSNITRNGLCRDAMQSTTLSETRLECEAAIRDSVTTVRRLGLHNITSECVFCSVQDLWHEVAENPRFVSHLQKNPGLVLQILSRYGPGRRVVDIIWSGMRWVEVVFYGFFIETNVVNISAFNVTKLENVIANISAPSSRRLLGLQEIADKIELNFNQVNDLHMEYATQLSTGYDYNYATQGTSGDHWRDQWPPSFEYPEDKQCQPLFDVLEILKESLDATAQSYTHRHLQKTPGRSIRESWPTITNYSATGVNRSKYEETLPTNVVEKWFVRILREILYVFEIGPSQIRNIYLSSLAELRRFATCDFPAMQTCSRFNVKLIHGLVIMTIYFSLWFLFWNSVRMPMVLMITAPLFVVLLLYLCYGYSPVCGPIIPVCMVEDIQETLRFFLPKFFVLPRSLIHDKAECGANELKPSAACIKNCSVDPFEYNSWESVFSWGLVEIGGPIANYTKRNLDSVPFIDHSSLHRMINRKEQIIIHGDDDLLVAQRICAFINSYLLIPYLLLVFLLLSSLFAVANVIPTLLSPIIQVINQLYVAIFTK